MNLNARSLSMFSHEIKNSLNPNQNLLEIQITESFLF